MIRPRSGRLSTAVTPVNIEKLRWQIRRNNVRSTTWKSTRKVWSLLERSLECSVIHFLDDRMKSTERWKWRRCSVADALTGFRSLTVQPIHQPAKSAAQLLKRGLKGTGNTLLVFIDQNGKKNRCLVTKMSVKSWNRRPAITSVRKGFSLQPDWVPAHGVQTSASVSVWKVYQGRWRKFRAFFLLFLQK